MKSFLLALGLSSSLVLAQGPEIPPGPPGPTQKSLQEIWDRIGTLEATALQTAQDAGSLRALVESQQTLIAQQSAGLIGIHMALGLEMPWQVTDIPGAGNPTQPSIDFSPAGLPAIAYFELDSQDLRVARFDGAAWAVETVESEGNTGQYPSLRFDRTGIETIAFTRGNELVYARRTGGTWTFETITSSAGSIHRASLGFTAANEPRIVFTDTVANHFIRASRAADILTGGWSFLQLDISPFGPQRVSSSLAINSNGQEAVAMRQVGNLTVGIRSGGSTSFEPIVTNGSDGANPSIASGSLRFHAVSYYASAGDLHVAIVDPSENAPVITPVDAGPDDVGLSSAISYGPFNQLIVAYTDFSNSSVKFASLNPTGTWEVQTLAPGFSGGLAAVSMRHGPDGLPGIAASGTGRLSFITRTPFASP